MGRFVSDEFHRRLVRFITPLPRADMASLLFTDLAIDAWFLVDMCVQLCTALPLKGGDMAIDKKVIWGTFFRKQFFFFYALHVLLYIANFSGAPIWVRFPSRPPWKYRLHPLQVSLDAAGREATAVSVTLTRAPVPTTRYGGLRAVCGLQRFGVCGSTSARWQ